MDYEKILEGLERYSNADGYQYTIQAQAAEAIKTLFEENKRVWKDAKTELPKYNGSFLCVVAIPEDGGIDVRQEIKMLRHSFSHHGSHWNCEHMIVTHWMPLPELPET